MIQLTHGVERFAGQAIFIEEGTIQGTFMIHREKDHDYLVLNPKFATEEDYWDLIAFCAGIDD